MKHGFRDKLNNLLKDVREDNSKQIPNTVFQTPTKPKEETSSLFSISATCNTRNRCFNTISYDQHNYTKDEYQAVDTSLAQLRQKILLQTRNSIVSPRQTVLHSDAQNNHNKIKRKIFQLNKDCFNMTNRAYYTNRPIVALNQPIYTTQTLRESVEVNSPTKKAMMNNRMNIGELMMDSFHMNKGNNIKSKLGITLKTDNKKKMDIIFNPLNKIEQKKKKEEDALNAFKIFNTERVVIPKKDKSIQ